MEKTEKSLRVVGKDIKRIGALDLVLGKAKFSDDILIKGLLHLKIVRSSFPHALIKAIDTEQASKLPGGVRIFTAKDIPGNKRVGTIIRDQPVLAEDKVRYKGDPIALVAAKTEDAGEEALEHIRIHYEELEPVLTPERALEMGAPKIHEAGNLLSRQ